eukprot:10153951-Alexandrium_andersonii.AAC.1
MRGLQVTLIISALVPVSVQAWRRCARASVPARARKHTLYAVHMFFALTRLWCHLGSPTHCPTCEW